MQQPSWMAEAWRELGQSERPGPTHNPRIVAMFDELGHPHQADETAWCAAFVGACLERAGIASTRSLMARSYEQWGIANAAPTAGAVAVLRRGSDPALGHVGFLVGASDTHVYLLGGNQSDAVTVAPFDRDLVLAYRAPAADSEDRKTSTHTSRPRSATSSTWRAAGPTIRTIPAARPTKASPSPSSRANAASTSPRITSPP